jgi:hypothetical protein
MNDIIRTLQESLEQIVAIRPIALKQGDDDWHFFPSAELVAEGVRMREKALLLMIEMDKL